MEVDCGTMMIFLNFGSKNGAKKTQNEKKPEIF
jgi:hypothetical protein